MEELLIQWQKRIAERTAAVGYAFAVSKKTISETKTANNLNQVWQEDNSFHCSNNRE